MLHASHKLFGGRSKRLSTAFSLGFILLFLELAGTSASIVRASIISLLTIWAAYYGRSFGPIQVILLAAAITAGVNPVYIWSDAGWWLSFLAFFGVLVIAPTLSLRLPRLSRSVIAGVIIESLSAEVMTLPYVLHEFGQMSLVALIANVLVVSFIPLGMLLSMVAGLAGTFLPAYGGWFAWPAVILLQYMLGVAQRLSGLPHIFLENIGVPVRQMLLMYASIATICLMLQYKTKESKSAKITDKKIINLQGAMLERT
jgi:competence protein ComEC